MGRRPAWWDASNFTPEGELQQHYTEPTCSLGGSDLKGLHLVPASQLDLKKFPSNGKWMAKSDINSIFGRWD